MSHQVSKKFEHFNYHERIKSSLKSSFSLASQLFLVVINKLLTNEQLLIMRTEKALSVTREVEISRKVFLLNFTLTEFPMKSFSMNVAL